MYYDSEQLRQADERELLAEVGPGHVLYGQALTAVAWSRDDDVIVAIHGDPVRFAAVHLAYGLKPDRPPWPTTVFLTAPWDQALRDLASHQRQLDDAAISAAAAASGSTATAAKASHVTPLATPMQGSGTRRLKVTLRRAQTANSSTLEWAWVDDNGALRVQGQSLSRGSDFYEYEWAITVDAPQIPAVVAALGGSPGDSVLQTLAAYCRSSGPPPMGSLLDRHGIPYDFWSRVGD